MNFNLGHVIPMEPESEVHTTTPELERLTMQIVRIGNRYRVKDYIPCSTMPSSPNFWIDVDPGRNEINVPATGDIGPVSAANLVRTIQCAIDLATGLVTLETP